MPNATQTNRICRIACPSCGRRLRAPIERIGRRARCPICYALLALQFVTESQPEVTPETPDDYEPHDVRNDSSSDSERIGPQFSIAAVFSPLLAAVAGFFGIFQQLSPRAQRRSLYMFLRFGVGLALFLGGAPVSAEIGAVGVLWLLFGHYPVRWLTFWIMVAVLRTLRCKRCGFETDAVGTWGTGQHTDHAERHILLYRNPIDGSHVGHMDCPQCGSTILIQ